MSDDLKRAYRLVDLACRVIASDPSIKKAYWELSDLRNRWEANHGPLSPFSVGEGAALIAMMDELERGES